MILLMSSVSTAIDYLYRMSNIFSVSLDPPLPVYLFNVVSGLRDKSAKGYPIKKVVNFLSDASFGSHLYDSFCWFFGKHY
jgi:N1221-like protein